MTTKTYQPRIATQEMEGHTYAELKFAKDLELAIDDFFKVLNGEKKGNNAREFFTQLAAEVEDMKKDGK